MTDVLFTHSYFLKFDEKEFRSMMPYPPLGTLYAASFLQSKGYSVALFDAMLAESENELLTHLEKHQPKFLVIYDDDFNYLTKMCLERMRIAAFIMSEMGKQFGCTVIVHGSDSADHFEKYLSHGADFVIFGEGEQTLFELLQQLETRNSQLETINGLVFRKGTRHPELVSGTDNEMLKQVQHDEIIKTNSRQVLHQLDELPFPTRIIVDVERYRKIWKERHGYFSMNIVTTRGCPFHCNWCAKPIYGQVYNVRSPQNVAEEMKILKKNYSPDHLWFCDDIFGLKPNWIQEFSEIVNKVNAKIPFKCLSRADLLVKGNTIEALAQSGCVTTWLGAESGSQKILDAMDKGTTVEQIYESARRLKEHNIRVGFFLQFGYTGETKEDIDKTFQMVKDCLPDEIGVSVSYPLPGTKFYDNVKEQLGEKQNWFDSQDLAMMYHGTYSPDFYRALHKLIHKRFRIWKGMEMISSPKKWNTKSPRAIASAMYHRATVKKFEKEMNKLNNTVGL
ncbi:MAG: B12-binding domain-containing radical SAM protein [Ignavibacteriales bacterium]|nr:B12-binding domain-containing radical SAM protein [Ignavibacteriales bacterium]